MTQLEQARRGQITPEMERVAADESRTPEFVRAGLAAGTIVVMANSQHAGVHPLGVGTGLRTKVNANLGTSTEHHQPEEELAKARIALEAGADAIMDLSTAGDLSGLRQRLLSGFPACLGTVPVYGAAVAGKLRTGRTLGMTAEDMLGAVREQAEAGVDFMTIHAGVTRLSVDRLHRQGRLADIVSRGGSLLAAWMAAEKQENPYYERFDEVLEVCRKYDVTVSLGDGLRPGCLADATDRGQVQELLELGELASRCRQAGVQVMIEGPGHVPLDQITANVLLEKRLCEGAPFYVLGPLVTDVAAGHDHIACAIGGALAASAGADFLCYVTPAEHLRLPTLEDVREGVIAARIAAHAADLVKDVPGSRARDAAMGRARKALDWDAQIALALDPVRARQVRESAGPLKTDACSMCGEFCAMQDRTEISARD